MEFCDAINFRLIEARLSGEQRPISDLPVVARLADPAHAFIFERLAGLKAE